jgi:hypothetical protein
VTIYLRIRLSLLRIRRSPMCVKFVAILIKEGITFEDMNVSIMEKGKPVPFVKNNSLTATN